MQSTGFPKQTIKIWYDKEGNYLEGLVEKKEGYFRETEDDALMEKVDKNGI